jgi:hypothetical protein
MSDPERTERFDRVREAMERVRSGESEREEIRLPSGDKVTIHRDERFPSGIRIETPARHPSPSLDDPHRRAVFPKVSATAQGIGSRGSDGEGMVLEEGDTIRLAGDGGGHRGLTAQSAQAGKSFRAQAFGPAEERPPKYPADLPFIQNCSVSISVFGSEDGLEEARNAAWMRLSDPQGTLEQIKAQLRESGWAEEEVSQGSGYGGHTRTSLFTREGVERAVALISFGEFSQIMLFERVGR